MEIVETELPGVLEITPRRHGDERGWFSEIWNTQTFVDAGLDYHWVQDNESLSVPAGTVRGIHFQIDPSAQGKLVRVLDGEVFDVAVDLRRASPTFGQWEGRLLRADIGNQMLIPVGFGHAFATMTPDCRVAYKVTSLYDGESERVVAWDDGDIGIDWPFDTANAVLSAKDVAAPKLCDITELFA